MGKGYILLLILPFLFSVSCKKDNNGDGNNDNKKGELVIKYVFQTGNNDPFELYKDYLDNGTKYQFSKFRFYASNFYIDDHLIDTVYLVEKDTSQNNTFEISLGDIDVGSYSAIKFSLGVDPKLNTQSGSLAKPASSYPIDHPLSATQNMYWAWAPGYVFLKMEGNVDLNNDGMYNAETFAIHAGLDTLYQQLKFSKSFSVSEGKNVFTIYVDPTKFFDGYNLATIDNKDLHAMSTSSDEFPQTKQILENASKAFSSE